MLRPSSAARSWSLTTAWRVPSSSVKRRPLRSSRRPPTPRRSSAANVFVWSAGLAGLTKPVGWICTRSMSTSRAPTPRAILSPSPVVCGPSVVGKSARSGRLLSSRLSASWRSWPKPPDAMTAEVAFTRMWEPFTKTVACQPALPCARPVHLAFVRMRSWRGCLFARSFSSWPAAKVISAPTKALDGRSVRLAVWPPSCARIERSTPVRSRSQLTAPAESCASFPMRSGLTRAPALLVVSAMSDSTVVSSAALMPEEAFPEFPPR
mmetsp:Transcript_24375/g.68460  ORF Transcript_24375/g.68460 Transcript_24375/m.68460 type:complete len:265 (+) Transcript_24375:892-1686(+)